MNIKIASGLIVLFFLTSFLSDAQEKRELVLLKNHGGLLPLDADKSATIALIGAKHERVMEWIGDSIWVLSAPGLNMKNDIRPLDSGMVFKGQGVNGFSGKFYNNMKAGGMPAKFTSDKFIDFLWGGDIPYPEIDSLTFSASWDATLIPTHGPVKVKLIHNDGARLYLDGKLIIDAWKSGPARVDSAWINIEKGSSYNLQIDYFSDGGPALLKFGFEYIPEFLFKEAVDKARRADAAVFFIDQPLLFQPDGSIETAYDIPVQSELLRAVIDANPNTIAILQTDSAVDIESWAFDVPAIIQAWPNNEISGKEIAEVILGQLSPDGKLPFKWAMNENQNFDTRFPKGYGMTYTIIGIGKLLMKREKDGSGWTASVETSNVGDRAGTETLQLMVVDPTGKNLGLKAIRKVTLLAGQKKTVGIHIPYSAFEVPGEDGSLMIKPGMYEILVGTDEEHVKLRKTIELKALHINQYYTHD